jgi:MoxR-like ATPase
MAELREFVSQIVDNIETVIVGKRPVIEYLMVAILCEGHVLLEDVPGVGKTMLARSLATSLAGKFKRLQCTPDLLPNDVTGVSIYNQRTGEFEFRQGPAFVNVLLVDEINRATPRTQSALLEAMQEQQVTVDGTSYVLPRPFLVIATQNPIEYEGTFPLPEAQLDRFFMRLSGILLPRMSASCSSTCAASTLSTTCRQWWKARTCWLSNLKSGTCMWMTPCRTTSFKL